MARLVAYFAIDGVGMFTVRIRMAFETAVSADHRGVMEMSCWKSAI